LDDLRVTGDHHYSFENAHEDFVSMFVAKEK
jgi:hypothetical protein